MPRKCEFCGEESRNVINGTNICNACYDSYDTCDKCLRLVHVDTLREKKVNSEEEKLTKQECLDILDRYKGWNDGQKSVSLAFTGKRVMEDDILDARRELVLAATRRLAELVK